MVLCIINVVYNILVCCSGLCKVVHHVSRFVKSHSGGRLWHPNLTILYAHIPMSIGIPDKNMYTRIFIKAEARQHNKSSVEHWFL